MCQERRFLSNGRGGAGTTLTLVGQKRTHQRLAVDSVGLCLAPAARRQNGGRVDDMALDAFAVENTMNPEPVEAGLLDGDDWEDPVKTVSRLLLKLREPCQEAADIAGRDRMLGQLLAGAWRQRGDEPGGTAEFQGDEDRAEISANGCLVLRLVFEHQEGSSEALVQRPHSAGGRAERYPAPWDLHSR